MSGRLFRGIALEDGDRLALTARLVLAARDSSSFAMTFVNPHSFNLLARDTEGQFRRDLAAVDVVCADGIGVVWAARWMAGVRVRRLSFDLLAPALFDGLASSGIPVFLLGSRAGVAEAAAHVVSRLHPTLRVAGTHHGYVTDADLDGLATAIRESGAGALLIGAGAPLQERLAVALRRRGACPVIVTCGGYLDQVIRPRPYYPSWAYPLRLNWIVRLFREPRRLWRRYLIGNPRFLLDSVRWQVREADRAGRG